MTPKSQPDAFSDHGTSGLFARLFSYEQRSLEHDVGESGRQQKSTNWSGIAFRLREYGLTCRIDRVAEIVAFPSYTPLPASKNWLLGIANIRGNLAPVVDLGWYLFGSPTETTPRTRLLLTRFQNRLAGLVIDEVFGQRHFHTDDLEASDEWDETPLAGLVNQRFPSGDASWGALRLEALERRSDFMNAARDD